MLAWSALDVKVSVAWGQYTTSEFVPNVAIRSFQKWYTPFDIREPMFAYIDIEVAKPFTDGPQFNNGCVGVNASIHGGALDGLGDGCMARCPSCIPVNIKGPSMCGTSVDTLPFINAGIAGFFQGFACENDTVPTGRATLVQVVDWSEAIAIAEEQYLLGHRHFSMIGNNTILDAIGRRMFGYWCFYNFTVTPREVGLT